MNILAATYGIVPAPKTLEELGSRMPFPEYKADPSRAADGLVVLDPQWVTQNLVFEWFPILGQRFVHRLMAAPLYEALAILDQHPDPEYREYFKIRQCGTFVPRTIGWKPGNRLSIHALGLALDINWNDNPYGRKDGTIRKFPRIVKAFKDAGFYWGGTWSTPDDMHFQYLAPQVLIPNQRASLNWIL